MNFYDQLRVRVITISGLMILCVNDVMYTDMACFGRKGSTVPGSVLTDSQNSSIGQGEEKVSTVYPHHQHTLLSI